MFAAARAGLIVDLEMNAVFHALSEGSAAALPPCCHAHRRVQARRITTSAFRRPPAPAPVPLSCLRRRPFQGARTCAPADARSASTRTRRHGHSPSGAMPPIQDLPFPRSWLEPEEPRKPVSPFPAFQAEVPPAPIAPTPKAAEPLPQSSSPAPFAESVVIPANPVTGAPELISAPPVMPAAAKPFPSPVTPKAAESSGANNPQSAIRNPQSAVATPAVSSGSNSTRRLLLALLLGSGESEDVGTLMRLTRQLPGVAAAVCLHHGNTLACDGDGTAGAGRFLREASANAQLLPSLAALPASRIPTRCTFRADMARPPSASMTPWFSRCFTIRRNVRRCCAKKSPFGP